MHRQTAPALPAERHARLRLLWAGLLVLAMLFSQSLGLWHRVVHADAGHSTAAGVSTSQSSTPSSHVAAGKLFSNHHADTDCQLFDQLSHADSMTTAIALVLGLAVSPQFVRASHALAVARWHALFQARGPPSVR